jgi:hypothetical protein
VTRPLVQLLALHESHSVLLCIYSSVVVSVLKGLCMCCSDALQLLLLLLCWLCLAVSAHCCYALLVLHHSKRSSEQTALTATHPLSTLHLYCTAYYTAHHSSSDLETAVVIAAAALYKDSAVHICWRIQLWLNARNMQSHCQQLSDKASHSHNLKFGASLLAVARNFSGFYQIARAFSVCSQTRMQ